MDVEVDGAAVRAPAHEFRLLGPVEVVKGHEPIKVGGPRERGILAMLLLNAGRVVQIDQLVEAVWFDQPPPSTVRKQVQNRVSSLRRILCSAEADTGRIVAHGSGYVLHVDTTQLDLARFREGLRQADSLTRRGEYRKAADNLRQALGLWRGRALDGLPGPSFQFQARRLEEMQAQALERRLILDMTLGRHRELIPELVSATATAPFNENLYQLLIVALYLADRKGEALEVYRRARATLSHELGIEPGKALQELHRRVLDGADVLGWFTASHGVPGTVPQPRHGSTSAATTQSPVPRQLPPPAPGFVGRAHEIRILDGMLNAATDPPVVVICGTAGIGKTALALHWSHHVADRFPDGHLYLNLRGHSPSTTMTTVEALGQMLRSLGLPPTSVPEDLDEATALLRSILADRRALVVLDDAASVEQVRPLLPGGPGAFTIVTSRIRLAGLVARDGANLMSIDILAEDDAQSLLASTIGTQATYEPSEMAQLARLCAYLPLALRIAAANIATRHGTVGSFLAALSDGSPLSALVVDGDPDTAARTAFSSSYRLVPVAAQRMFRLLGTMPGDDYTVGAAAAIADVSDEESARLLNVLHTASLVNNGAPSRYRLHDLLRHFATELATDDESNAAFERLATWYLSRARAAARALYPQHTRLPPSADEVAGQSFTFAGNAAALTWFHLEWANITSAISTAAQRGHPIAWYLADPLRGYLARQLHIPQWRAMCETVRQAAAQAGDTAAQAMAHLGLSHLHHCLGRPRHAVRELEEAAALATRAGWRDGLETALNNLGIVHAEWGKLVKSIEYQVEAVRLSGARPNRPQHARVLNNLGVSQRLRGRPDLAIRYLRQAETIYGRFDAEDGLANTLESLGRSFLDLGDTHTAEQALRRGLASSRACGNRHLDTDCLVGLALVRLQTGDLDRAESHASEALRIATELAEPKRIADTCNTLAAVLLARSDRHGALALHQRALSIAVQADAQYQTVVAMAGIAATRHALGEIDDAREEALRALAAATETGYDGLLGQIRAQLAAFDHVQATAHRLPSAGDATKSSVR
ncbi:tetratricopeptide repeat protein [Micromonospora sp. C51]|uniref:AfsR/SARP family transcriptional regulator n=1 Tax=Micromonospora sp. C51 TaxID=2824879 RepID=UPI001B35908C|nr:AfsR/SARP family transcriptional regulator [Micromonospora sp. C51]MBQ1053059.1 tetratricopeptide repeat protein [Micromonospora sp. C51]